MISGRSRRFPPAHRNSGPETFSYLPISTPPFCPPDMTNEVTLQRFVVFKNGLEARRSQCSRGPFTKIAKTCVRELHDRIRSATGTWPGLSQLPFWLTVFRSCLTQCVLSLDESKESIWRQFASRLSVFVRPWRQDHGG